MALTDETLTMLTEAVENITESGLAELVLKRLDSFGYTLTEKDVFVIAFNIQKVENYIKNECNVTEIPKGLINNAVDMVCGEFLSVMYGTGKLELDSLDMDGSLKAVEVGDTSVSFDGDISDENKFNMLVQALISSGKGDFACYRAIKW